jgi:hypothetical protein
MAQGPDNLVLPLFFMRKQSEASNHIKELLSKRGLDIRSGKLTLPDDQQWIVYERGKKQVGIDTASGVWVRIKDNDWRCIGMPCTVSCAIQAVDFLSE